MSVDLGAYYSGVALKNRINGKLGILQKAEGFGYEVVTLENGETVTTTPSRLRVVAEFWEVVRD